MQDWCEDLQWSVHLYYEYMYVKIYWDNDSFAIQVQLNNDPLYLLDIFNRLK
jgi:hypothetical protein